MSEWQDISTAPRDGTKILLFFPEGFYSGREDYEAPDWSEYEPAIMLGFWSDDDHPGDKWVHDFYEGITCHGDPTHWMPLPPPPAKAGE